MWPFNKKENPRIETKIDAYEELKRFREIGEEFNYLGRRMICTAHSMLMPAIGTVPMLCADYVDSTGRVRSIEFMYRELPAIKKQNPEASQR